MKLLYLNQIRKIKENLLYIISISMIVFIVSLSFTAFKSSVERLGSNYGPYLEEQKVEHFYLRMGEVDVSKLGGTAIIELCQTYEVEQECGVHLFDIDDPIHVNQLNVLLSNKIFENPAPYEALLDFYVSRFEAKYDIEVEKQIVIDVKDNGFTYKFRTITYDINIPYIIEGTLPYQDNEIMLYPEFMKHNNLEIGDTITIHDKALLITGSFYSPDYTLPLFSTNDITYDEEIQSMVLMNEATIRSFRNNVNVKYTAYGSLDKIFEDYDYQSIYNQDYSVLGREMQMIDIFVPREINFRITSLQDEVDLAETIIDTFLVFFTILSSLLLLIFMNKYIQQNKKDITILQKIGYTKNELTKSLMVFPFITVLMTVLGYVIGLLLSTSIFEIYAGRYYYPKAPFTFDFTLFVNVVILPSFFIIILSYYFVQRALQFKPKKVQKIKWRFMKYTGFKIQFTTFMIFLIASVLLLFGLNANTLFDTFAETTVLGNNYEKFVMLRTMTNEELKEEYQTFTRLKSFITEINDEELDDNLGTYLYGIDPSNNLKLLINNDIENNKLLEDGIIISDFLHEHSGLSIGDSITFTIGSQALTLDVKGISNELVENNMFIQKKTLNNAFGLDDSYYNGIYLTDQEYVNDNVYRTVDYEKTLEELIIIFNTSSYVLQVITTISVFLAVFVFIIIVITFVDNNRYAIATLKAIGYNNKEITYKYFGFISLLVVLSYVIAIPITNLLFDQFVTLLIETMGFKFILELSLIRSTIGFISLLLLYGIVIYYANVYFNKANISLLLKKEEK